MEPVAAARSFARPEPAVLHRRHLDSFLPSLLVSEGGGQEIIELSYFRGSKRDSFSTVSGLEGGSSNYVIKRSTFGLTRHHGHCIVTAVLLKVRHPGSCYRRSSAPNPSFLWGWLGMVMVASLKRTLSYRRGVVFFAVCSEQGL